MPGDPAILFRIEPGSSLPIYQQLVDQVRQAIASGRLTRGDRLPSLREVASELVINHLTVKQAYTRLEHDGLITTVRGRGTFVNAAASNALRTQVQDGLTQRMAELAASARRAGLTQKQFQQLARQMWNQSRETS